jgi:hypothetical protein
MVPRWRPDNGWRKEEEEEEEGGRGREGGGAHLQRSWPFSSGKVIDTRILDHHQCNVGVL